MNSIDGFPRDPNKNKPLTASYNQTQILTFNRALQKNNIQAFNHLTITYLTPCKEIPEKQKMEMKQRKIDEYLQEIKNKPDNDRRDKIFPDLVITTTDRSNDKVEHLLFCQNFMVISQSPVLIKWWRTERVNRMNKSPGLMYNILPMPEFDVNCLSIFIIFCYTGYLSYGLGLSNNMISDINLHPFFFRPKHVRHRPPKI